MRTPARTAIALAAALFVATATGCGTTRTSNTSRTATEQLLISDAIDRTVESLDFSPLTGEAVFLDETRLAEVVDKSYLISSLRQRMLASGLVLKAVRDEATYVVEPRAGAIGTDDHDLLFGIPAVQVPQVPLAPTLPAAIPEVPLAKRKNQRGIAKLAVFAYRRDTGEPVFQTGLAMRESTANNTWVFGAGPFKRGTIYEKERMAEERAGRMGGVLPDDGAQFAAIEDEAVFVGLRPAAPPASEESAVIQASGAMPVENEADAQEPASLEAQPLATAPPPK